MSTLNLSQLLVEGLEQDYYIQKTTDSEVKDLLLRGHYLGAWPFAGSQYKDYIYGIYLRRSGKQLGLNPEENYRDDPLVGCLVYGLAEPHASSYVSKWLRGLLDPDDSIEGIYNNIVSAVEKDREEERKAKERGYPFRSKTRILLQNILHATNLQDNQILELKRLYILPQFDMKNIESFAIAKGNKSIFENNPRIQAIVSFSDSKVGHHGGVYQATNALYAGLTKRGLHRYIYPRDSFAATIRKYQDDYEELVFQYPEPQAPKGVKQDFDFYKLDLSKRERIVVRYLKSLLPNLKDASLKAAVAKVLDMIERSPQRSFQFKEIKEMVLSELFVGDIIKKR